MCVCVCMCGWARCTTPSTTPTRASARTATPRPQQPKTCVHLAPNGMVKAARTTAPRRPACDGASSRAPQRPTGKLTHHNAVVITQGHPSTPTSNGRRPPAVSFSMALERRHTMPILIHIYLRGAFEDIKTENRNLCFHLQCEVGGISCVDEG